MRGLLMLVITCCCTAALAQPGPFERVLPEDGTLISEQWWVDFSWTQSAGENVQYFLHVESPTYWLPHPLDFVTTETSLAVEIPIPVSPLDAEHEFNWTVCAFIGDDTVQATNGLGTFSIELPEHANHGVIPPDYRLAAYPNPFNSETLIEFALSVESVVHLQIFNVQGERVAVLANEMRGAGLHTVHFNAAELPTGVYFSRIQAGSFVQTQKLLLIK